MGKRLFKPVGLIERIELPCYDGHKSFYGRAYVYHYTKGYVLKSYNTMVAEISEGKFNQLWDRWSATTQRHVDAFRVYCGLPPRPTDSAKRRFINRWFSGNEKGYRKVRKEHYDRVLKKWKMFIEEEKDNGNITVKQYQKLIDNF